MRIVWLASYPRSGSTYLRFLLYGYLFSDITDSMEVEGRLPDLHKMLARGEKLKTELDVSMFIKTHFLFGPRHPHVTHTTGFIYLLRNPRDVLLSNSRFSGVTFNRPIDVREFALRFIDEMGVSRWRETGMGTWSENFASWYAASASHPHLFVRYEDLKAKPAELLRRLLDFLEVEIDEARLERAVRGSALESMRRLEDAEREREQNTLFSDQGEGNRFVGSGLTGQSLEPLGEEVESLYQKRFGSITQLFGYE